MGSETVVLGELSVHAKNDELEVFDYGQCQIDCKQTISEGRHNTCPPELKPMSQSNGMGAQPTSKPVICDPCTLNPLLKGQLLRIGITQTCTQITSFLLDRNATVGSIGSGYLKKKMATSLFNKTAAYLAAVGACNFDEDKRLFQ